MCCKSFGVGGKAGSPLSRPSAARGGLVRGFLPAASFLPARPPSPRPRDTVSRPPGTERARLRRGPSGGHAPPAQAAPWGSRSARPAPSAPGPLPPPGPPQGTEPPSPGLGSAHARRSGQPPAPGAARSWVTAAAARPALPCGLPSACCCEGGGAHSRWTHSTWERGLSPGRKRGGDVLRGGHLPSAHPVSFVN